MTVVVTLHDEAGRIEFHMFSRDTTLMGVGDMPSADAPRNIRYWKKLGWNVHLSPARR